GWHHLGTWPSRCGIGLELRGRLSAYVDIVSVSGYPNTTSLPEYPDTSAVPNAPFDPQTSCSDVEVNAFAPPAPSSHRGILPIPRTRSSRTAPAQWPASAPPMSEVSQPD